jgi:NADH-quinone oxidoreductase subunit H
VKSFVWIMAIFWVRTTLPRLRIDQLMSFCWKVLLPLALVQLLVNGFILAYGWPEELLFATSLVGAVFLLTLVALLIRRPKKESLVGAYRGAGVSGYTP